MLALTMKIIINIKENLSENLHTLTLLGTRLGNFFFKIIRMKTIKKWIKEIYAKITVFINRPRKRK